jgi:two-component system sensor histidine kinase and response regulator WspE
MSANDPDDLSGFSMLQLFRLEVEAQRAVMTNGLLVLEEDPRQAETLEALMRAAHSLKGAARIINLDVAVELAHRMEDLFSAGQRAELVIGRSLVDLLLRAVDLLNRIAGTAENELGRWQNSQEVADLLNLLARLKRVGRKGADQAE